MAGWVFEDGLRQQDEGDFLYAKLDGALSEVVAWPGSRPILRFGI